MSRSRVLSAFVVATIAVFLMLPGAGSTQRQEKGQQATNPQQATAVLTVLCVGGCEKRGEGASVREGKICCGHDQSKLQGALSGVKGVSKVAVNPETRKVTIEYVPGQLNLTALVKAADKAGFDIML